MRRRDFITGGVAVSTASLLPFVSGAGAPSDTPAPRDLVDVSVSLSRWPLRRLPLDDTLSLVTRLRSLGIAQAWAGNFDALLHKDLGACNRWLASECRERSRGMLLPFGSVNPAAPDWEEEWRRCVTDHGMRGLRLHPGYHGYGFDHPALRAMLQRSADAGIVVQMALGMEDERMMHPLLRVTTPDTAPLAPLVREVRGLRLVILHAFRTLRGKPLLELAAAGEVCFDIATLEGVGALGTLLGQVPLDRVVFGSHAPLFYPEAALLKLVESPLTGVQLSAISATSAKRLLRT